ncbi:MAG: type II toxin-antitoxin system RelE/ParE family toxin [Capsulimonadaceae bacterium]
MIRKVIITDDAFQDLDEISEYIGEHAADASLRFLQQAQRAFELLAKMPGMGARRDYGNPVLAGVRMWPVPRFRKYLIFYHSSDSTIEIVRVLHGSRNIQALFSQGGGQDALDL